VNFRAVENKLLQDNLSGSSELLNKTIQFNIRYLKQKNLKQTSFSHLIEFNKKLINQFAAMTKVVNGCQRLIKILHSDLTVMGRRPGLLEAINNFKEEICRIDSKIINRCDKLFEKKVRLVTYSNSGLVKKVLTAYRTKIKRVILSEARPAREGIFMAEYLSGLGLKVTLCTDMLLPELMSKADCLLLGADSVGPDKFVNKIGTSLLLHQAKQLSIKRYVLCESLKFRQTNSYRVKNDQHPPNEIMTGNLNQNINLINRYFEIIPNRLVNRFISDSGNFTPASLQREISKV